MRIQGTGTGVDLGGGNGVIQGNDAETKNLQNQIQKAKERLQELSSDDQMSAEEKMKKRQEIQKEITELTNQLRQHQIELRREKQQEASANQMDELTGAKGNTKGSKGTGLSKAGMKAMVSADVALDQAREQSATATQLEGRARVLEGEIGQDKSRGIDTADKEEELAQVKEGAASATASQIEALGKAGQEMEEAAGAEQGEETSEISGGKEKDKEGKKTEEGKSSQEPEKPAVVTALPGENVDVRL